MGPPPGSISLLAGINVVLCDVQTRHVLLTADLQMWPSAAGTFEAVSENDFAGSRSVLPVSAIVR
jgi:hypothetical protein